MSAKNRRRNLKTAKAQRQKKIAIVLGAIFALVLVVQVPRTLKKLNGHSSPPAAAATSPAQTPASATSTTATATSAATSTAAASSSKLPESDLPPRRSKSQLSSFERFGSKDPFVQQVTDAVAGTPGSAGAAPTATASSSTAGTAPSSSAIPAATQAQPAQAQPAQSSTSTASATPASASSQKMAAAVIEVNGQPQTVDVSQAFPQTSPTFRLVSVSGQAAMIGIAGGSFASGSKTLTLQLGKSLTLMNTSGGQRYELRLMSVR